MDKYDGRYAFWEKYETLNLNQKRTFLTPASVKIMKDIGVNTYGNFELWKRKTDILTDHIIKSYDLLIEKKNAQMKEVANQDE